jgi:hypothetical protein
MQVLLLPVNDISRQFTTENNNKDWQANKNLRDRIHVYKVECNTFVTKVSTDVFFYVATGIILYSQQGIVVDKVMESINLVIEHKYGKEIYLIQRFDATIYERELSNICEYTQALDLTWVRKVLFLGELHFKM